MLADFWLDASNLGHTFEANLDRFLIGTLVPMLAKSEPMLAINLGPASEVLPSTGWWGRAKREELWNPACALANRLHPRKSFEPPTNG